MLRFTSLHNSKVINGRLIIGKGSTPPAFIYVCACGLKVNCNSVHRRSIIFLCMQQEYVHAMVSPMATAMVYLAMAALVSLQYC